MLIGVSAFTQDPYVLSTYTSPYAELTNSTQADLSSEDEDYWDDPEFPVPLGFDFTINGESYSNTTQVGYGALFLFGDINTFEGQVFGVYDDIIDAAGIDGEASSEISYKTEGLAGNQIAKIQYSNSAFYEEVEGEFPSADNRTNFQVWFYEDGGIMEVHFGASNIPDPQLVYLGNPGPTISLALDLEEDDDENQVFTYGAAASGSLADPGLSTFTSFDEDILPSLNAVPESGRVYRFTPSNPLGIFNPKAPEFSIYPTITESNLWVKGETNANANYRIMDITGKEVLAGRMQNQNVINVSNLNSGVYLFSIDGMSSAAKFIKK